jgi:hypothetical protein
MTQALYAHMNNKGGKKKETCKKVKKKKKKRKRKKKNQPKVWASRCFDLKIPFSS